MLLNAQKNESQITPCLIFARTSCFEKTNKQTNKQTIKQTHKQTPQQTNKQTKTLYKVLLHLSLYYEVKVTNL